MRHDRVVAGSSERSKNELSRRMSGSRGQNLSSGRFEAGTFFLGRDSMTNWHASVRPKSSIGKTTLSFSARHDAAPWSWTARPAWTFAEDACREESLCKQFAVT
jgi:DNA mismatch repair protein MutS